MSKLTVYTTMLYLITLSISLKAQNSGRGFQYQGIAVDSSGNPLQNETITIRFSLQIWQSGSEYYAETHTTTTDTYGAFKAIIGHGSQEAESMYDFMDVGFYRDFWLKTEIETNSGYNELSLQKWFYYEFRGKI